MSNIYDILELCLQELQTGADLESVLARYPDHVEELRPTLSAAVRAQGMAVPAPSDEMVRRNRAKFMQQAARMREEENRPFVRFVALQKWVTAFALLFVFLFAGTRLINASADALPGDGLYAAKRIVENLSLFLAFDAETQSELRTQFADERLRELNELLTLGITASVDFTGVVTEQRGDAWQIAGIPVFVTSQTGLPDEPIQVGAGVRVEGITRGNFVLAERIEFLPVDAALPIVKEPTAAPMPISTATGSGSATEAPSPTVTPSSLPTITSTRLPGNNNVNSNTSQNNNSNDNGNRNDNDDDVEDDDDNENGN